MVSLNSPHPRQSQGLTLVELVVSVAMGAVILAALSGLLNQTLRADTQAGTQNDRTQDARFAVQRMASAVAQSNLLILPTADNPNTTTHPLNPAVQWIESVREQSVPATVGREFETAVLAVGLASSYDIDKDGFSDADNDRDGRIDEDPSSDLVNDAAAGIFGIDDDGDGSVDEGSNADDDEDGSSLEDPFNQVDDDGDGRIDEDTDDDANQDGFPGIVNVDDDKDSLTDEGNNKDDDEDGQTDEDWPDALVFFLQGSTLIERRPNIHASDGLDYSESPIAEDVVRFRVERLPQGTARAVLVSILLELAGADGDNVVIDTRMRVGGDG